MALVDRCAGDSLGSKNQDSNVADHRVVFRNERIYAGMRDFGVIVKVEISKIVIYTFQREKRVFGRWKLGSGRWSKLI